ncbi:MAG: chemotaxis protein MotA [Thermoleophilia bacterium]|nr:chemotaxis protein MotA [Thermoleophilia bacterium]
MADDLDLSSGGDEPIATDDTSSGGSLDISLLLGLAIAFGGVIGGLYMEGSSIGKYFGPSAAVIVLGGTLGVTIASVGLEAIKGVPGTFMRALKYQSMDRPSSINTLVGFAEKARREGLLVLEDDLRSTEDEFLRRGVQLVVDGTDPELVKEILRTEVDSLHEERHADASVWETMGGFAPTLGICGTVIGLVLVLSNISDPSSLAASIAVAFIATLYGLGSANLIFLPVGNKLKGCATDEIAGKEMLIEGILAIQSGDNPRIVEEKLVAFLTTKDRAAYRAAKDAATGDLDMDLAA